MSGFHRIHNFTPNFTIQDDKDVSDVLNNVLVFTTALSALLSLARGVRGPQGQIVPQQLHDQGAVLVAVLVEGVQLGNGIIECLIEEQRYSLPGSAMCERLEVTCLAS